MSVSLLAVAGRLVHLQVLRAEAFEDLGARQRVRHVELPAKRGTILDRNGVPLAMSVDAAAIYANPQFVTDAPATAAAIAPLLGLEQALIRGRLQSNQPFVYLARKVELAAAERVLALKLPGIGALDEIKRVYPAGSLAAQVVGFVGTDNVGLGGLEAGWEQLLAGVAGEEILEQDPRGRPIAGGESKIRQPERGQDLILTIDRDIQFATEEALERALKQTGAKNGTAIVLEPKTGDILAMANWPPLDPTAFGRATGDLIRNRAVQDAYEPGSVNKVITAAAALEGKLVEPSEMLRVPDSFRIADKTFRDFQAHKVWKITYAEALARSSNVGTIQVALRVGKPRLHEMLGRFGLGVKTGIGFPGESPGILLKVDDWYSTSIGTIPIGQGIAVTPLQVAQVYGTLANDGVLVPPRLVRATVDREGKTIERDAREPRRVVSPYTAAQIRAMLVGVVENGTGRNARIPGYLIGGKTGTARKPLADARGYSRDVVTTFVGMVPADAPRFVVAVVLDTPDTHTSSATAAPVFSEIARFVIARLKVPPALIPPSGRVSFASLAAKRQ
ncbi:MAG: peptidoglycan D,D-transpeptidase FtsI family protein [Actinomycetota bacterium]